MPPPLTISDWHTEFRCIACTAPLSFDEVMCSNGRCPRCGHKEPGAGTIVATTEHAYRTVRHGRWWEFWKSRHREYAAK